MMGGLGHLSFEDKLWQLWLSSLEKRRLQGAVIVAFQFLKGAYKKDGDRLFSWSCCNRVLIGKGVMVLIGKRAGLDWKNFFTMKVLRCWNSQYWLCVALSNLL